VPESIFAHPYTHIAFYAGFPAAVSASAIAGLTRASVTSAVVRDDAIALI
jgi:hypothetical protein